MQFLTRFARTGRRSFAARAAFALGAAMTLAESRPAVAQVPETGVWINDQGKGAIEIKPCGAALCGNIVWLKDPLNDQGQPLFDRRNPDESKRNRPICGLPVIGNVKRTSEGWDEGWIYSPEEGAQYDVAFKASGNTLVVTGYKGIKLFSKTLTWTRAPADLPRCDGAPASQTKAKPSVAPAKLAAPTTGGPPKPPTKPVAKDAAAPAAKSATAPAAKKPATAAAKPGAAPSNKAPVKAASTGAAPKTSATKATAPAKPGSTAVGTAAGKPTTSATKKTTTATTTGAPKPVPAKKPATTTAGKTPEQKSAEALAAARKAAAKNKAADEAEATSAVE